MDSSAPAVCTPIRSIGISVITLRADVIETTFLATVIIIILHAARGRPMAIGDAASIHWQAVVVTAPRSLQMQITLPI